MFDEHKAKQAAKAHAKAVSEWQGQRDGFTTLLAIAQQYQGTTDQAIVLGPGEAVFYKVTQASLVEQRRGTGHYAGHSQGVSFPIANIAGRPIRYRVGVNKGHYVQGAPVATAIDTGTVFVTNQRVIFQGANQTRVVGFGHLVGIQADDDDGSTTFSESGKQKPVTIRYGKSLAMAFDFRLNLALAHFQGKVSELVQQLQAQLNELDTHRPPDVTAAPTHPVPLPDSAPPPTEVTSGRSDDDLSQLPPPPVGAASRRTMSTKSAEALSAVNSAEQETLAPTVNEPDVLESIDNAQPEVGAVDLRPLPPPPEGGLSENTDAVPAATVVTENGAGSLEGRSPATTVGPPIGTPVAIAQPGWYADPWKEAALRWWDGAEWTGYVNPAQPTSNP